jgi:hypothetical protein
VRGQVATRAIPARCLAALLISSLAASPALADRPAPPAAAAHAEQPGAPALPSSGARAQGRALLLARQHEPTPTAPNAQTVPLPQPAVQSPQAVEEPKPLDRWWFWAAAGGLLLATGALFLVATSGNDRPSTRLGNMEAFR